MAVKLIKVKCPECGATMDIEENRQTAYCTYCGTKMMIHNENEHVYRRVDEARIREAETERLIRLKELEIYEREQEEKRKSKKARQKISLILGAIGALMLIFGYMLGSATGDGDSPLYMIAMVGFFPMLAGFMGWPSNSDKK